MNLIAQMLREFQLWRHYPGDRKKWIMDARCRKLQGESFELDGQTYSYWLHPYNHTWANERIVEVAVARAHMKVVSSGRIVEVGNVMSHYTASPHPVVDRYERCFYRPIINSDVLDYTPEESWDLLVSLSTFEHIGWDESPREPAKVLRAWEHVRRWLSPRGKGIVTVPIGWNDHLDEQLRRNALPGARVAFMRRISEENRWIQVDSEEALSCRYGAPYPSANAVAFLFMTPALHGSVRSERQNSQGTNQ